MDKTKAVWINALFLLITLAINTAGALGLINGLSQKQISDMYVTLITPSPFTFSIWSVIYVLLIISVIVMIIKKDDPYYQKAIDGITGLFIISCILNIAWIVAFSFVKIELSVIFILGFVVTLSLINLKLKKIQVGRHFLLPLTFGLYTGWLFIATVVNISAALVKLQWNGFGISTEILASATLIIALFLVFMVLHSNRNAVFTLPVAWAYWGIYQFLKAPEGFNGEFGQLQIVTIIGIIVLVAMAIMQFYKNHFKVLSEKTYK